MDFRKNILPYCGLLALGILWGSNFSYMKIVSEYIEPMQIAWLRFVSGLLPVFIYALMKGYISFSHLKHIVPLSVMALGGTAFYYYAYAVGTSLLYSGIAGLLSGSIPLFSFIAAYLFLRAEKLTISKLIGTIIGFAGIIIIAQPWELLQNLQSANLIGVLHMIAGSAAVGISFVYAKKYVIPLGIHPLGLVTYQLTLSMIALAFITDYDGIGRLLESPKAIAALVIGLGLLGTAAAYVVYYYIIDKLGAVSASGASYLAPLIAFAIGVLIIGENIAWSDYIAAACILLSVFLINRKKDA